MATGRDKDDVPTWVRAADRAADAVEGNELVFGRGKYRVWVGAWSPGFPLGFTDVTVGGLGDLAILPLLVALLRRQRVYAGEKGWAITVKWKYPDSELQVLVDYRLASDRHELREQLAEIESLADRGAYLLKPDVGPFERRRRRNAWRERRSD